MNTLLQPLTATLSNKFGGSYPYRLSIDSGSQNFWREDLLTAQDGIDSIPDGVVTDCYIVQPGKVLKKPYTFSR